MATRANRRVHIVGLSLIRDWRSDRTSFGDNPPGGGQQGDAAEHRTQAAGVQDLCPSGVPLIGESLAASRAEDKQRRLGAPFKPGFGLSGIPQHSTLLFSR